MKPSQRLFELTYKNNVPVLCSFELTERCNLKCKHCYIPAQKKSELTTKQVKNVLKQLASKGVLYLVFTGGEVFLRDDFIELCCYARKLHFDLRIFTNATLLTDKTAEDLSSLNVSGVEISLYGRKETHEYITGVKNSFEKTIKAIKLLKKRNIPVSIKTPLMNVNAADYKWLKSFAEKNKLKLRIDPTISPSNDGNKKILKYRLYDKQLKKLYNDDLFAGIDIAEGDLASSISCSAGFNMLGISCEGKVYPCLQLLTPIGDVKKDSFSKIWSKSNKPLREYRNIKPTDLTECISCKLSILCQRCPGLALVEDGDIRGPSKIACKIAGILYKKKASKAQKTKMCV